MLHSDDTLPSALPTVAQWRKLEADVFDGGGVALERVRELARWRGLPPIAFLVAVISHVLVRTPPTVTLDAGLGPAALNLFAVLMGPPSAGKDSLMNEADHAVRVVAHGQPSLAVSMAFGSGEGLATTLQDYSPTGVMVEGGEIGALFARMERTGSTLRGNLLACYSGNQLSYATKTETIEVPRNSYRCCMWLGAQPDKAALVTSGADDGFRHRFVWCELLDPDHLPTRPGGPKPELCIVDIPQDLLDGEPISFPEGVINETWEKRHLAISRGQVDALAGHRNLTALKVAAGLCLLRSDSHVSMDDWRRAQALMTFSDAVQQRVVDYSREQQVNEVADRLECREEAQEEVAARRVERTRQLRLAIQSRLLERINNHDDGLPPLRLSEVTGPENSRNRHLANQIMSDLARDGVVVLMDGAKGGKLVERGHNFHAVMGGESASGSSEFSGL